MVGHRVRLLDQLLEALHRRLDLGLGAVDDLADLLRRRVARLLELLRGLLQPAVGFLGGLVGLLLRLLEVALAQLAGRGDRLVEELLGHLVGGLRLLEDGRTRLLRLGAQLRLQVLEDLLRLLVGPLALLEDLVGARDRSLRLVLRPGVRLVRRGLAVLG